MKKADAYWLSPKGKTYEVPMTHINFIRDNLNLFKLTMKKYQETYKKYKEPFGWEGKARNEIIIDAMKRGWCRIRNHGNSGWSVEVWELDKYTQNAIFDWAMDVKKYLHEAESYSNVNNIRIHVLKDEAAGKPENKWNIPTSFAKIRKGEIFENKKQLKYFKLFETEEMKEEIRIDIRKDLGQINEAGLSRIWKKMTEGDFAFFTVFRSERTEKENRKILSAVVKDLNKNKLGPYLVDGHYTETDVHTGKKINVSESSLMVAKPDGMEASEFIKIITEYAFSKKYSEAETKDGTIENLPQESILLGIKENSSYISGMEKAGVYLVFEKDTPMYIGSQVAFNKLGDNYSKMKGKDIPFIFEGQRIPKSGYMGSLEFNKTGLKY